MVGHKMGVIMQAFEDNFPDQRHDVFFSTCLFIDNMHYGDFIRVENDRFISKSLAKNKEGHHDGEQLQ